jgi:hypothetical protein
LTLKERDIRVAEDLYLPNDEILKTICPSIKKFEVNGCYSALLGRSSLCPNIDAILASFKSLRSLTLNFLCFKPGQHFWPAYKEDEDVLIEVFDMYCCKSQIEIPTNIDGLSSFKRLDHLSLVHCEVAMNLSALSELHLLTYVNIDRCPHVSGTIESLSKLDKLTQLRLQGDLIGGNISFLSSLSALASIHLETCAIDGNISSLSTCTNLEELTLVRVSQLKGEIRSLSRVWRDLLISSCPLIV